MFQQINAIFGRAFIEQDNARLDPPGLTVRQESQGELYARLAELEGKRAELWDELRALEDD